MTEKGGALASGLVAADDPSATAVRDADLQKTFDCKPTSLPTRIEAQAKGTARQLTIALPTATL